MDQFQVVRELGTGSFGVALLVQRIEDDASCVVKKIKMRELSKRDAMVAQREVAVMQRVQHPHIIGYLDSFVCNEFMHIIMEYADGGTLQDKIKASRSSGAISEPLVARYFSQTVLAVHHLHQHRILHRDLKSANVFLTAAGDVKVRLLSKVAVVGARYLRKEIPTV
jgi:serine/threonine protein kinase